MIKLFPLLAADVLYRDTFTLQSIIMIRSSPAPSSFSRHISFRLMKVFVVIQFSVCDEGLVVSARTSVSVTETHLRFESIRDHVLMMFMCHRVDYKSSVNKDTDE